MACAQYNISRAWFLNIRISACSLYTIAHLFLRATNFENGTKKGVRGSYFHKTTLAICMNLHVMEFLLIFGETNFVEALWPSEKECPTVLGMTGLSYVCPY